MLPDTIRKRIKKLHQRKYREEFGQFLVEGIKGVREAMDAGIVQRMVIEEGRKEDRHIAPIVVAAEARKMDIVYASNKDIGEIKTTDMFPGVMAIVTMPSHTLNNVSGSAIYLDGVTDPGNLGTIIRTADWFGIHNILLSKGCVDPFNDKSVRSSMGSLFRATIVLDLTDQDIQAVKKEKGYEIIGFALNGQELTPLKLEPRTKKSLFVFGSESHGISREIDKLLDRRYTISGMGGAESLNVAVSSGIAFFAFTHANAQS